MSRREDRQELDLSLINNVNNNKKMVDSRRSNGTNSRYTGNASYNNRRVTYVDEYEDAYGRREKKEHKKNSKTKKYKKKKKRVLFTLLKFIIILVLLTFLAVKYVPGAKEFLLANCGGTLLKCFLSEESYNNIFDEGFNKDDIMINEGVDIKKFEGYYTVALFGIDARDGKMESGVNADSIIVVSINQDTGEVVMSSIYRDTWLKIPSQSGEERYRKINSAFSTGGAVSAINAMNSNFDLHISDYVTVNFQGLATIIDMLGGLDMNITDDEKNYINEYLDENMAITGMKSPYVKEAGNVHLNGLQAVAYCRIRYTAYYYPDGTRATDDMGRTARQRYVLSLMIDKAKAAGVSKVMDIAETIFSGEDNIIKTSISYDEMTDMIPAFIDFELAETKGFPFTYDFPDRSVTNGQSALVPGGLVYNVRKLHQFLYGDNNFIPSDEVIEIDGDIKKKTGVDDIELP